MPRDQAKARGTALDRTRFESGAQSRGFQFGAALLFEEQGIGGDKRLATNPCLDGIETLGSLMDIVEIGDVMEGAEQLDQAFSAAPDSSDWRRSLIFPKTSVTTPWPELSGHTNPRSSPDSPTPTNQAYVNDRNLKTTNMALDEILHKIFGPEMIRD